MDPAQALADLTEVSPQIEAAVLADGTGAVVASTSADGDLATRLAGLARELVAAAEQAAGQRRTKLVQIEAALADGHVFVVRDEAGLVAAVTVPKPTAGLVFYDLKTCLRHVAGEEMAPKPRSRVGADESEGEGA